MKILIAVMMFFALTLTAHAKKKEIVLSSDNVIVLKSAFNDQSVTELMKKAKDLDSKLESGYPIFLFLYTPGGSIEAGLELFEFLDGINRPVHTITSFAASMGFQTVQHLGKRYILRYGTLMSHKARGGFRGEFGGGLSQLDSRYHFWLKRLDMMDKVTVERSNGKQTLKSYRASYDNELWLTGEEAVSKGYADEVVVVKCDNTLTGTESTDVNMGFFKVTAKFSKCPMIIPPVGVSASLITNKGEMTVSEFLLRNGKFGKSCNERGQKASKDYYGNITPAVDPDLCASDKNLTLDKIQKTIKEKTNFFNRDLRDHIQYSY